MERSQYIIGVRILNRQFLIHTHRNKNVDALKNEKSLIPVSLINDILWSLFFHEETDIIVLYYPSHRGNKKGDEESQLLCEDIKEAMVSTGVFMNSIVKLNMQFVVDVHYTL